MNEQTRRWVGAVLDSIGQFELGMETAADIQTRLQTLMPLLERDSVSIYTLLRLAEADLEEIAVARILSEQRAAAMKRLGQLRSELEGELNT